MIGILWFLVRFPLVFLLIWIVLLVFLLLFHLPTFDLLSFLTPGVAVVKIQIIWVNRALFLLARFILQLLLQSHKGNVVWILRFDRKLCARTNSNNILPCSSRVFILRKIVEQGIAITVSAIHSECCDATWLWCERDWYQDPASCEVREVTSVHKIWCLFNLQECDILTRGCLHCRKSLVSAQCCCPTVLFGTCCL